MYRFLLLALLSGPAFAAEIQEPALKSTNGCPSSAPAEGPVELSANSPAPGAPPALKSSDSIGSEPDQRPRARSRGPAWHSFLPGMFK